MAPDCHVIVEAGIVYFPESGKFYAVPQGIGERLKSWLAGHGEVPPEAAAMLAAEAGRGKADLPPVGGDEGEVRSLCLYTAHDCNLACTYCYNQRGRAVAPLAMMSFATAKAAIDRFFWRPGVLYAIALYGGEPLLNVGLIEPLVDYAERLRRERDIRIDFSLTTNGTVMNREILALLDRHFVAVTVSLDGIKAVNDRHRHAEKGEHSVHDRAVATIRLLKENTGLRVTVKGTLTAQGGGHYQESLAYLRSLGADNAALTPAFGPAEADWALAGEVFERYVAMQAGNAAADLADLDEAAEPWHEYTFQIVAGLLTKRRLLRHCNIGRDLAVMADGAIYACHGLAGQSAFAMGRVDDPASPDFQRLHEDFAGLDLRSVDGCQRCWARYLCGGGCYANAWFQSGSVRQPDRGHCAVFKAVAEKVLVAFVDTVGRPEQAQVLLRKVRGMIGAPPPSHV
ncbi:radical SAM/SPASM domain-containing protein [Quatrionicoccus australiensis]|uniref:radical SAM/SPASM domain-containing protein n=1 Tax=Quatrionicoccus australiensis TaxID=138118 RepID=UPI001CF97353|nr:radical SAM protein [Quatrionicoccus australiensis]MCB4362075.1 SPASM domain-containing protein [Quatrionicoccus australiensis]